MNDTTAATGIYKRIQMTFFWGKNTEILFPNWPGSTKSGIGVYLLALLFVFVLSFVVEWISRCDWIKSGSIDVGAGLVQTILHGIKVGLAYMVMLALMSFNIGVFLVCVAGNVSGFWFSGRKVKKSPPVEKPSDLTPLSSG